MKNLYFICGKSGSGKATVVKELDEKCDYQIFMLNNSDLSIIEKEGINGIKRRYCEEKCVVIIYIDASEGICIERMRKRGDSEIVIWKNMMNDADIFIGIDRFADFIVDGDGDNTWEIVADIVNKCEQSCEGDKEGLPLL